MTAGTALAALQKFAPDVLEAARAARQKGARKHQGEIAKVTLDAEAYGRSPEISWDYAVMEKAENISAIVCDFGWSDLGSWPAIGALVAPDADGNRVEGDALMVGTHNSYVRAESRLVGLLGLDNMIVVDTADALLVADAARAADVRGLYAGLKAKGHEVAFAHRTVFRPWGTYTVLLEGPGFKIKRITVNPGGRLSLQRHKHRSEHWVVVSGRARITHEEMVREIGVNQSAYIEMGARHRLENPGEEPLELIEVQCGNYLGEDDIERFDDHYGR
jgi:mannose-1-phosphate guanylyltransferase